VALGLVADIDEITMKTGERPGSIRLSGDDERKGIQADHSVPSCQHQNCAAERAIRCRYTIGNPDRDPSCFFDRIRHQYIYSRP